MNKINFGEDNHDSFELKENKPLQPPSPKLSIKDLQISTDFPFPFPLDFQGQIKAFLSSGTLKQIEHLGLREKVHNAIQDERIPKICAISLEIVLVTKYPTVLRNPQYLLNIKKKLSKKYVKLFSSLPQPKDEIVNYLIFICSYNVHWMLWKICKDQREEMDLRFVFDCYHIIIFCLNGIYVSDSFVRLQIEKIFSSKFMDYEREKKEKLILQKLEKKKKTTERTFLGRKIDFPDVSRCQGGPEFTKMLNDKFRIKKAGQFFNGDEQSQIKPEQTKFNLKSSGSQSDNNLMGQQQITKSEAKLLLQNLQLNVNQISPSIFHVLQMNKMQLPFSRKKMLSHTFEKNDDKTEGILNLLKEMTQQRKLKKDPKQAKKFQKSLIEIYDLRAPGKEYFQKHSKVDALFKDMLELNYVLQHQQESLNSLYSTKELQKNLEELPDDSNELLTLSPQKRVMAYLLNRNIITAIDESMQEQLPSPDNKSKPIANLPPIQGEKHVEAEPQKPQLVKRGSVKHIEQLKSLPDEPVARQQKAHHDGAPQLRAQKNDKEDELYQDKKTFYKLKYEPLLSKESTDSKITGIVQNLQAKQNLIGKSLSKKIHRL